MLTSEFSRKPMATPSSDHEAQERLQGSVPYRRVRLHHYSHLSFRPNRLHGLLQGRQARCIQATP